MSYVGYNPIESLDGLDRLQYLKSLSLSNCWLRDLPPALFGIKSLEELRLANNMLCQID